MRPIDFVVFDGDSEPNLAAHKISEAMLKPIKIAGHAANYQIISYYYYCGKMILEIEKIEGG